ncbi:MarR family transcriptional regulator [Kitasatospora sp. NBC_01287]|uniref:MarR family winged helix-turn-helix transcriptional regulator n=1 Tax=Kitasatospora sp. NBC_01287 TaxID=2903573 RepID=UPI00225C3FFD|nr:MarR family transcriptional regulator [Kitasatospora sp. NBC_01287]MCX4744435.1 MarR family transcriptional regulator [Kitasatospora sp. NBC_01287]
MTNHDTDPGPDRPEPDLSEPDRPEPDLSAAGTLDPATVARLRLVVARLYRQLAQASSGQDLTFAQLSALARIEEHGPVRLGELAALERVAAPSMTRTVTPLVTAGLAARLPDPRDGRSFLVEPTPTGRALLARIRRQRSELLTRRIGALGAADREALGAAVPVLERLLADGD